MANVTTLLKYSLKTNIVKSIYFEIISKVSRYYYTFGKSTAWPTVTAINTNNQSYVVSSEDLPPAVPDTYPYELQTRGNIVYMKYIDSNDAAVVVNRYNWTAGFVYDMYDDYSENNLAYSGAASIDTAQFYVLTDQYNVYKCLSNNRNAQSVTMPVSTSNLAVTMDDGYVWKFMYTIPLYLRNKFLSGSFMPVVTALDNQFYSNGAITAYSIENRGFGYVGNTWKVKRIIVINGGKGYTTSTPLTFQTAPSGGVQATASITQVNESGSVASISVTNQGSLYTTQPTITVTPPLGASGLDYIVEYESTATAYTKIQITGDGHNEYNPYSLKQINVINGGSFDTPPSGSLFTFPTPPVSYGTIPIVSVTFGLIGATDKYEVKSVSVVDTGYGYSELLVFDVNTFANALTAGGFLCDLNPSNQKNEAEAIPILTADGEIRAIQVTTPGVGYTYASVDVIGKKTVLMLAGDPGSANLVDLSSNVSSPGYTAGFTKASIILDFGIGTIDTRQSNVELLAKDGSIEVIKVDVAGFGYNSSSVITVVGDGTGCVCQPVIQNGQIISVIVTNPGVGYTYADISATIGSGASLRAIISPRGGHGKDAISELYAKTILLYTRLSNELNKTISITNDFRQVGIIKNPKIFGEDSFYRKAIASSCLLLTSDVNSYNTPAYNSLNMDDTLYYSNDNTKTFTLIEKKLLNDKYYLVVSVNNNFIPTAGSTLYKTYNNTDLNISISSVENPDINKYSGELLYIDNRVKFASTVDQTIAISTLITF